MPGRVWTREKLISEIKKLNKEGVDLSPTSIQKTHGALFSSARSRSHFGNWREAVEASGLDYDEIKRVKQRWSHDEIIKQIRQHAKSGEDLLDPRFKLRHRGLYLAACAYRYFGSWKRAVEAAGIDHEKLREQRVWTKQRVLRSIQELAKQGKPLGWAYVELHCPGIYRAARRKENFGSWHNALLAAGVTPSPNQRGRRPNVVKEQMAREAAAAAKAARGGRKAAAPAAKAAPAKAPAKVAAPARGRAAAPVAKAAPAKVAAPARGRAAAPAPKAAAAKVAAPARGRAAAPAAKAAPAKVAAPARGRAAAAKAPAKAAPARGRKSGR